MASVFYWQSARLIFAICEARKQSRSMLSRRHMVVRVGSANASAERGGYNDRAKIIAAVAVAFLLVVAWFHLAAAHVPGRDRLGQVRQLLVAAAAVAGAGAQVTVAEPARPAFFLFGRALHPLVLLHHLEARPADEVRLDLLEVHPVPLRP